MIEFYEDDGIEIDDASLLATMATTTTKMETEEEGEVNLDGSMEEEFLGNFRTEVAEVDKSPFFFFQLFHFRYTNNCVRCVLR